MALVGLLLGVEPRPAESCYAGGTAPGELVRRADVIVRVRAVDQVTSPASSPLERPFTTVRFLILEQLKGDAPLFDLAVRGSLVEYADFNDRPVPYWFVRRGGRSGSCYANTYQRDGEYPDDPQRHTR